MRGCIGPTQGVGATSFAQRQRRILKRRQRQWAMAVPRVYVSLYIYLCPRFLLFWRNVSQTCLPGRWRWDHICEGGDRPGQTHRGHRGSGHALGMSTERTKRPPSYGDPFGPFSVTVPGNRLGHSFITRHSTTNQRRRRLQKKHNFVGLQKW